MTHEDLLIDKLVTTCHIVYGEGWREANEGHVSIRPPGRDWFLIPRHIHPSGRGLGQVTRDDMMQIGLDGHMDDEPMEEHPIHLEIYRRRPDIGSVVFCKPFFAVALGVSTAPLRMLSKHAAVFGGDIPRFDPGPAAIIVTEAQGRALAEAMGERRACLVRASGAVTVGEDVEEACVRMAYLEHACRLQATAASLGSLHELSPEAVQRMATGPLARHLFHNVWGHLALIHGKT